LRNGTGNCNRSLRHALPEEFARWFTAMAGAAPASARTADEDASEPPTLLIAPTGCGKTLAGFLPTLVELHESAGRKRLELRRAPTVAATLRHDRDHGARRP